MLRRSILELSCHRGSHRRLPRQIISQRSSPFLHARKQFSTSPGETPKPGSAESKSGFSRVVLGSAVIVGAALAAYQAGHLDQYLSQVPKDSIDSTKIGFDDKDEKDTEIVPSHNEEVKGLAHQLETSSETPSVNQPNVEGNSNETQEKPLQEYSQSSLPSADHDADNAVSAEGNLKIAESETDSIQNKEIQDIPMDTQSSASLEEKETEAVAAPHSHTTADRLEDETRKGTEEPSFTLKESQIKTVPSLHPSTENIPQGEQSKGAEVSSLASEESQIKSSPSSYPTIADIPQAKATEDKGAPSSLLDAYHLREKEDESFLTSLNGKHEQLSKESEGFGLWYSR